jgi:ACR3 family arsenite transporter
MSVQCETTGKRAVGADMPFFERYLSVWVALCIVVGIVLGRFFSPAFDALGAMEVARVNIPVAVIVPRQQ